MSEMKICVLASGRLGFESLIHLHKSYVITGVFTDWASKEIINFAKEHNIFLIIGNPRNKNSEAWHSITCDVLLSINYLFIINKPIIEIAKLHAINVHGSLLPKYRGRTPHVWAIINGEKKTGISAHRIEEGVDTGDIVLQKEIVINENDTGAIILEKFRNLYPELLDELLNKIILDTIEFLPQNNDIATYFDKRTPENGLINWNWFRERIKDWIRAQAHPYPGAFFFYEGIKVFVHKAILSEYKMRSEIDDGTILKITSNSIIVKTPNGCIELTDLSCENLPQFEINKILL